MGMPPAEDRSLRSRQGCVPDAVIRCPQGAAVHLRSSAALRSRTGRGPNGTLLPWLPRNEQAWVDNARKAGQDISLARRSCAAVAPQLRRSCAAVAPAAALPLLHQGLVHARAFRS